jgi:hypothetical protein
LAERPMRVVPVERKILLGEDPQDVGRDCAEA